MKKRIVSTVLLLMFFGQLVSEGICLCMFVHFYLSLSLLSYLLYGFGQMIEMPQYGRKEEEKKKGGGGTLYKLIVQ